MKRALLILILFVFAVCFTFDYSYAAEGFTGNINLLLGTKGLEENDWTSLDSQTEFGVNFDFGTTTWPVFIDIAYFSSSDDLVREIEMEYATVVTVNTEASTSELRLGVKYIWDSSPTIRPYVAAGIANIRGKLEVSSRPHGYVMDESMDESAVGFYITGGLYWTISEHFNLGAELGYSLANIDIMGMEIDAGGTHILALIGYHF